MAFWRPCDVTDNNKDNIGSASESVQEKCAKKDLHVQTQRIILNIYNCLKNEDNSASDNRIVERICQLTKLSRTTIFRVIRTGDVIDHYVKRKKDENTKITNKGMHCTLYLL